MTPDIITLDYLTEHGLTLADVRERCPQAPEYTDDRGQPYWLRSDLEPLLAEQEGDR
jgi:hypothetical protein